MPNRRKNRRRKRQNSGQRHPNKSEDVHRLIARLNQKNASIYEKKFLVYCHERLVCKEGLTKDFIKLCLSSYFVLGEENYQRLSCMQLGIPPLGVIRQKVTEEVKFTPGLNDEIFQLIEVKTENYESGRKTVVVIIDETVLKREVKTNGMTVCGVEDNGKLKTDKPAKYVTILWVSCIGCFWMSPVSFIFTNQLASVDQIQESLFDVIRKLDGIGLDVVGVVTKMRSNFYKLSQHLKVSPENPTFKVDSKELVFIFDVPQLMNITRNNLMKYKFQFNDKITSWKYIKEFFIKESQQPEKKTKLTIDHLKLNNTNQTCSVFAIELLSNTVASEIKAYIDSGWLPAEAIGTAEFIDLIDKLFDVLNSSQEISMNDYASGYKGSKHQVKFLEKMIAFFQSLKILDDKGEDQSNTVLFLKGWLISIKAFMKLWEMLKPKGFKYMLTNNINSENLDNFVWLTRFTTFSNKNPTPSSFLDNLTKLFFSMYFTDTYELYPEEFSLEAFTKKIYKRVPNIRHDLGHSTLPEDVSDSDMDFDSDDDDDFLAMALLKLIVNVD